MLLGPQHQRLGEGFFGGLTCEVIADRSAVGRRKESAGRDEGEEGGKTHREETREIELLDAAMSLLTFYENISFYTSVKSTGNGTLGNNATSVTRDGVKSELICITRPWTS